MSPERPTDVGGTSPYSGTCETPQSREAQRRSQVRRSKKRDQIVKPHPRRIARTALTLAVGASLVLAGAGAASAATDEKRNSGTVEEEEYRATSASDALFGNTQGLGSDVTSDGLSSSVQALSAAFVGRVDAHYPHKSSSQASGHVTWTLISGTSQKIKLTSTLKARTSWVTFRTMAGPTPATVYPGGGAGRAAVARYDCNNSTARDWYTYGEGFAPGTTKPFGSHSSTSQSVNCEGGLP